MEQQICELRPLLNQVHGGQSGALLGKAPDPKHLAQQNSRIIEAQRLIEVAGQEVMAHEVRTNQLAPAPRPLRAANMRLTVAASRNAASSGATRGRANSAPAVGRSVSGAGAQRILGVVAAH
jgi:hypothetical protein